MPLKRKEWPGFTVNLEKYDSIFRVLDNAQAGELFHALLYFCRTGKAPMSFSDSTVQIYYSQLTKEIMKEKQAYALVCYRRSAAGKKKWQQRKEDSAGADPQPLPGPASDSPAAAAGKKKCYGFHCTVFLTDAELASLKHAHRITWQKLIHDYDLWAHENDFEPSDNALADLNCFAALSEEHRYL